MCSKAHTDNRPVQQSGFRPRPGRHRLAGSRDRSFGLSLTGLNARCDSPRQQRQPGGGRKLRPRLNIQFRRNSTATITRPWSIPRLAVYVTTLAIRLAWAALFAPSCRPAAFAGRSGRCRAAVRSTRFAPKLTVKWARYRLSAYGIARALGALSRRQIRLARSTRHAAASRSTKGSYPPSTDSAVITLGDEKCPVGL